MIPEIFMDIPGYEGKFQASIFGRIKSIPRIAKNRYSSFLTKEKILNPFPDKKGYPRIRLFAGKENFKSRRVHQLVLSTFVPNPNPKKYNQVNHINGIKTDNHIQNLEWANNSINQLHAHANGLNHAQSGAKNHFSKKVRNKLTGEIFDCANSAFKSANLNISYSYFCAQIRKGKNIYEYFI